MSSNFREFAESYINHSSYPRNLIPCASRSHHYELNEYGNRLDEFDKILCLPDETQVDVPVRDFYGSRAIDIQKCNIHSEIKLDKWLGVNTSCPDEDFRIDTCGKKDLKCRFIYIYAVHSRDYLRLTRDMMTKILTFHQVMPEYLDFIFVFGAQSNPRELRFSGFREETMLGDLPRGPLVPGRSGRQFQLCYNLKGVTQNKKDDVDVRLSEWSIRPAAILHQFDVVHGSTLWIVTKGRRDLQQRYKSLTGPEGRKEGKSFESASECFRSSLETHLMFCRWATEDWRWYILWMEDALDAQSSMAIYGARGPGCSPDEYEPDDIQNLQYMKDKAGEAALILESNIDVILALRNYYVGLKSHNDFPLKTCEHDIDAFEAQVSGIIDRLKTQASRARFLITVISDRKELILQHLQGQASERTNQLNKHLRREAIVMRIITLVTLLYLPATFVSTFFSTDIIQFHDSDDDDHGRDLFLPRAMMRWLQVTIPLTVVTICFSWLAYKSAQRSESSRRTQGKGMFDRKYFSYVSSRIRSVLGKLKKHSDTELPVYNDEKQV